MYYNFRQNERILEQTSLDFFDQTREAKISKLTFERTLLRALVFNNIAQINSAGSSL